MLIVRQRYVRVGKITALSISKEEALQIIQSRNLNVAGLTVYPRQLKFIFEARKLGSFHQDIDPTTKRITNRMSSNLNKFDDLLKGGYFKTTIPAGFVCNLNEACTRNDIDVNTMKYTDATLDKFVRFIIAQLQPQDEEFNIIIFTHD